MRKIDTLKLGLNNENNRTIEKLQVAIDEAKAKGATFYTTEITGDKRDGEFHWLVFYRYETMEEILNKDIAQLEKELLAKKEQLANLNKV